MTSRRDFLLGAAGGWLALEGRARASHPFGSHSARRPAPRPMCPFPLVEVSSDSAPPPKKPTYPLETITIVNGTARPMEFIGSLTTTGPDGAVEHRIGWSGLPFEADPVRIAAGKSHDIPFGKADFYVTSFSARRFDGEGNTALAADGRTPLVYAPAKQASSGYHFTRIGLYLADTFWDWIYLER